MIYTVTFNPALDYIMRLPCLQAGETNRSTAEVICFGGKGINVSRVLKELGQDTTILGFVAGFTGEALSDALERQGLCTDLIRLPEGMTRINVKLKETVETEINAGGPSIDEGALEQLFLKLEALQSGDTLVLAGSVPSSVGDDVYGRIAEQMERNGVRTVVDATGSLLKKALPYHPFLIKPNHRELEELAGHPLQSREDLLSAARELQAMGAQNVLVSLGAEGALLLSGDGEVFTRPAPAIKAINTVGAGDSMVAGFLAGLEKGNETALALAVATGSATASCEDLATKEVVTKIFRNEKY